MSRSLTEIRKDIQHDTCADVRSLCEVLGKMIAAEPDTFREILRKKFSFGKREITEAQLDAMVQLYGDKIEYVSQTFNNK